jgi:hypothetical protein
VDGLPVARIIRADAATVADNAPAVDNALVVVEALAADIRGVRALLAANALRAVAAPSEVRGTTRADPVTAAGTAMTVLMATALGMATAPAALRMATSVRTALAAVRPVPAADTRVRDSKHGASLPGGRAIPPAVGVSAADDSPAGVSLHQ